MPCIKLHVIPYFLGNAMLGDMAAAGSVKAPAPFVVLEAYRLDDSSLFQISHPALDLTQSKARELGDAQRRGPAEPPIVIDFPAQSEHHDEAVSPDFPYGKLGYKPLRDRGEGKGRIAGEAAWFGYPVFARIKIDTSLSRVSTLR